MALTEYTQGDLIEFDVLFKDGNTKQAVDPTSVSFAYRVGTNASSTPITYASATSPAVGTIARLGPGRYRTWVDSTPFAGTCYPQWTSTGAGQAASPAQPVVVNARDF